MSKKMYCPNCQTETETFGVTIANIGDPDFGKARIVCKTCKRTITIR